MESPVLAKPVLPKLQAREMLESLPFRDRLMAMIAAFYAMRPGEIFGLQWSSWRGDHFQIEGTAWRGSLRPGKAKTKGSKAPVTVPNLLVPLLQMWREQHASASPDALVFPSEKARRYVRKIGCAVELSPQQKL
jgi:integrase